MQVKKRLSERVFFGILTLAACSAFYVSADSFSDSSWRQPVNDLGLDGKLGTLYVHGTLTESACRLSMDSAYQVIDLGNASTAQLQYVGDKGHAVPFDINLLDCVRSDIKMENFHNGTTTWSVIQPAVKVRFLAPTITNNSTVVQVLGAKGLGLQITTPNGEAVPIGIATPPHLLSLNNNRLMYYVTPIRVATSLEAGQYSAVINFELIYD
ncbi:type 1 fimbria pilin [Orbus hercynius]|uniref:Type 1 fimbria pilin n=1 Tax=Orbus hercynius TaxID=593135 RepID=A0A495RCW5_9GAMM|nr:fimbrial protein [Orbus hercynius]RKS85120.1 type 1 fimbria pilin [Orbus hercynius]